MSAGMNISLSMSGFAIYFGYGVRQSSENRGRELLQAGPGPVNRDIEDPPPEYQEEPDPVDEKAPLLSNRPRSRNGSRIGINGASASVNQKGDGDSKEHVYANVTDVAEPTAPPEDNDDEPLVHSKE